MLLFGIPACPPTPFTSISKRSTLAIKEPSRTPIVPTGKSGLLCIPNMALTPSSAPAFSINWAPWATSSAGWKMILTVPFISVRRSCKRMAAPMIEDV